MQEKYYIDTLTWRDYYENRKDRFRPLGEWTFEFFKKAMRENSIIMYSDFVEDELEKDYNKEKINDIFSIIDKIHLLKRIEVQQHQFEEANKIRKKFNVPFGDAVHAVVARDENAIVISRDHHYEELQDIVICKKPEDLL